MEEIGMLKEFKQFISRGNVIDLAIGIIIGGAFGKIISSLVNDIVMPPIGLLLGNVDFANLYINLSGKHFRSLVAAQAVGAPTINYGLFINTVINFLIVSLCIFIVIRQVSRVTSRFKKPVAAADPTTKACPYCITEISILATRCPHCTSQLV